MLSFSVHRVTRLAKQSKITFPERTHAKRLGKAAVELCGAWSFHELSRWFEQLINQNMDTPEGPHSVSHCLYCDYRFAVDHKPDQKSYREVHEHFMEAEEKLGYRQSTYTERERMRKDGYDKMNLSEDEAEGVDGLLMIARSWLDRSIHSAIAAGLLNKHPTFKVYVVMMIPQL